MRRPGLVELFAALPVAVIVTDADARIVHANARAEQLLNLSERLMIGQPLAAIATAPGLVEAREAEARAIYDVELIAAPGQRIRADITDAPVPDYPGWRATVFHAVAASRRFGDAAERVGGGGRAAAMLAHEIKNPLSGIRGAAQLLGPGELTGLITREVDRIAALIDRMQGLSDTRPLPISAENIYPLLDHARSVAIAGFSRGVGIETRFDPSLPRAAINPDAFVQVVINLLKNAREAVGENRIPRIALATAYRHGMAVSPAPGRPRVPLPIELCVVDNGPGAPDDIADHLFEPFVSGRRDGQGLGLALVDKLIRGMGGIVQYAREGDPAMTVFRLLLPRAAS